MTWDDLTWCIYWKPHRLLLFKNRLAVLIDEHRDRVTKKCLQAWDEGKKPGEFEQHDETVLLHAAVSTWYDVTRFLENGCMHTRMGIAE